MTIPSDVLSAIVRNKETGELFYIAAKTKGEMFRLADKLNTKYIRPFLVASWDFKAEHSNGGSL